MIYISWIACCIGSMFVGYLVGADLGYRKAHDKLTTAQQPKTCGRSKCEKTGGCETHRKMTGIEKLRLLEQEDINPNRDPGWEQWW